jgi:hypothetical protein
VSVLVTSRMVSSTYTLFALLASVVGVVNAGDDDWVSPVVSYAHESFSFSSAR